MSKSTFYAAVFALLSLPATAFSAELAELQLVTTRAGDLRLVGLGLDDPAAAPALLERATHASTPAERMAYAQAFSDLIGAGEADWQALSPAWLAAISTEADPGVADVLVRTMRRAPSALVPAAARAALARDLPGLRTATVQTLAWHRDGATFSSLVTPFVSADAPELRQACAQYFGWTRPAGTFELAAQLTEDPSPAVRAEAWSALAKLDAERASGLPQLAAARVDEDPKVRRAASRVSAP